MVNYTYSELKDWTSEMIDGLGWILSNKEDKRGYTIEAYKKSLGNLKLHLFKKAQSLHDIDARQDLFILLEKVLILEQRIIAVQNYFIQVERAGKKKVRSGSPYELDKLFKTPRKYKKVLRSPTAVKPLKEKTWADYIRGINQPGPKKQRGFLDWFVDPNAEYAKIR